MRRLADLMKDLGFKKDSPIDTQKSFVRHLIRVANGKSMPHASPEAGQVTNSAPTKNPDPTQHPDQLAFDPNIIDVDQPQTPAAQPKKTGNSR